MEKKKVISTEELCSEYPKVFYEFVKYSKGLKYSEEPKYDEFKNKFVDFVVNQRKEKFDYIFDWTTKEDIKKRKETYNITLESSKENNDDNNNNDNKNKRKSKEKIEKIEEKESEESKEEDDDKEEKEDNEEKEEDNENEESIKDDRDKEVEEKTDKVESQCCLMYVYILYNFFFYSY